MKEKQMNNFGYDTSLTFTEQGLRPDMVFDFYFRPDKADPRYSEYLADMATMSMDDWKAKWSPNSNYKPLENAGGATARQEEQFRASLAKIADEAITKFELNQIPAYRLDAGNVKKQLKVKTGGEQIRGEGLSAYISLRLEKPHFNIWLNVLKPTNVFAAYFEAGVRTERQGNWIGKRFTTLDAAKEHFFDLIKKAKEDGQLGG